MNSHSLPTLRLLVISSLPNDAEEIGSVLRNSGYAARTRWCSDTDKAVDILADYDANLIFCGDELPQDQFRKCLGRIHETRPGVPLLALGEDSDPQATTQAMGLGAHDRVVRSEHQQLQLIVSREFRGFCQSRDLAVCQAQMAVVETRHDVLLNQSSEPIAYLNEGILTRTNPAYARLLGFDAAEELESLPIMDFVHEDDRGKLKKQLKACLHGKAPVKPVTLKTQKIDGTSESVDFYFSEVTGDNTGQVEILARAPSQAHGIAPGGSAGGGHNKARRDSTAGRFAVYEALKRVCSQQSKGEAIQALFFVAVDGFQAIEMDHGFPEADQTLDALQTLLMGNGDTGDEIFQFAPGELVILGSRETEQALEKTAQDWCKTVAEHEFQASGHALSITLSVAVCPLSPQECEPQSVLKRSRETLAVMRNNPEDKVRVLTARDGEEPDKRGDQHWFKHIKQALRQDDFELNYQSIASLEGEDSSNFEVTVRMLDEHKQDLKASEFMPTAEKHGLTQSIDRWVIEHAFDVLERQDQGSRPQLFIKLAEDSLIDADFIDWLRQHSAKKGHLFAHLTFELKTAVAENLGNNARKTLMALRDLDAKVALERVDAGPRTLSLLQSLPLDFLKLDPSITENLGADEKQRESVTRVMENAREKKIKTIAERVEKANSMATLWQFGVNYVQGHYVQEPAISPVESEADLP